MIDEDREALELYTRSKEREVIELKKSYDMMFKRYERVLEEYRKRSNAVDKIFEEYMLMSERTWEKIKNEI